MGIRKYRIIVSIVLVKVVLVSFVLPSEVLGFSYTLTKEQTEEAKNYGREHGLYPLVPEEKPLEIEEITEKIVEKVRRERFENLWKWTKEEWVVPGIHYKMFFWLFDENIQKDSYLVEDVSLAIVLTPFLLAAVAGSIQATKVEEPNSVEPESVEKAILMEDVFKQKLRRLASAWREYIPIIVWTQKSFYSPEFILKQEGVSIKPVFVDEKLSVVKKVKKPEKQKEEFSYEEWQGEEMWKSFSSYKLPSYGKLPPNAVGKFYYLLFPRKTQEYTIDSSKRAILIVKSHLAFEEEIVFVLDFENMR